MGYCTRLNPMGKTSKDANLHAIAKALSEDDRLRERICGNIYMGERPTQLLEATHAMQSMKEVLAKEKKGEKLTTKEARELKSARALQKEIITVDSFKHAEYMRKPKPIRKTTRKKA
jgi:hypothetical protein